MRPLKFGFDIDDTLINLREHAFHLYNKKLEQQHRIEVFQQIERVEIHEPFGLTDAEGKALWESSLEEIYYTDCPSFPGAVQALADLERAGHEIYYITARPKEHGVRTREWMKTQGFPVMDSRFFYGMKDEEKVSIITELELDCYVDDKPNVLQTLANTNTYLLVKNQSYNQDLTISRLNDWPAFCSVVEHLEKTILDSAK